MIDTIENSILDKAIKFKKECEEKRVNSATNKIHMTVLGMEMEIKMTYSQQLEVDVLREQNKKLKAALEFYAQQENLEYPTADNDVVTVKVIERGELARQTLDEVENT